MARLTTLFCDGSQFAYSIASTQAPGGPLQYDLHGAHSCTAA